MAQAPTIKVEIEATDPILEELFQLAADMVQAHAQRAKAAIGRQDEDTARCHVSAQVALTEFMQRAYRMLVIAQNNEGPAYVDVVAGLSALDPSGEWIKQGRSAS